MSQRQPLSATPAKAMPLKAIVFDLDGTLIDTAPDFIYVLNRVLAEEQRQPLPDAVIRTGVSHGSAGLIELGFGIAAGHPDFDRLRQRLLDLYLVHLADNSRLFSGIDTLLQQIRDHGLQWGIATNKPARYTEPLLQALQLEPDCVICPDHVRITKPDPESLLLASRQLQCEPGQLMYVGDHERDIECGRRAGSITIAALYGYIDASQRPADWQATHSVSSAAAIWPLARTYL